MNSGKSKILFLLIGVCITYVVWTAYFSRTSIKWDLALKKFMYERLSFKWPDVNRTHVPTIERSLCSDRATRRGPGQYVVSFCYYEPAHDSQGYYVGIKGNAEKIKEFYPNWTMRVYHEMNRRDEHWLNFQRLEGEFYFLDFCNVSSLGDATNYLQASWRLLPMADPLVDAFVSRDLDSRPSLRESAAVAEWLASNYSFHIMRDHPYHSVPMPGGMWGCRRFLEPKLINSIHKIMKANFLGRGSKERDQVVLGKKVFPLLKGKMMQHDSFHCESGYREQGGMRPFPTRRENRYNFVGAIYGSRNLGISSICPLNCRPQNHINWMLC